MTQDENFYVVGVSYKNADLDTRGLFGLDTQQLDALMADAKEHSLQDFLVVNTCNRTELLGWAKTPEILTALLCKHTQGSTAIFKEIGYVLEEAQALQHIFRVGTGLDSQILGDFEIIAQVKKGFFRSKRLGLIGHRSERLINAVIQASKRIKTETEISTGATSVSFASVQYILKHIPDISNKKIVLFGTGKIGRNTCQNLIKHTQNDHIVVINRTLEKAQKIAKKFPVRVKQYEALVSEIAEADVLIVATGASQHTVHKEMVAASKPLLILDLSLPKNVNPEVGEMDNISLLHLDDLSQMTDATLKNRRKHIPKAEAILSELLEAFQDWLSYREYAPVLKAFKEKLLLGENGFAKPLHTTNPEAAPYVVQKLTGKVAAYLKQNPLKAKETMLLLEAIFELSNK